MTIRVVSLDFDGCMFNQAYHKILQDNDYLYNNEKVQQAVISANQKLLDQIILQAEGNNEQIILTVGSNRQNPFNDKRNSHKFRSKEYTHSCYISLSKIHDYISSRGAKVFIDKILLVDIEKNLEPGTGFDYVSNRFKNISDNNQDMSSDVYCNIWSDGKTCDFFKCTVDESKLAILYAQMHKIASENLDETINFDFYDDKNDILEELKSYFINNPEMIPSNVHLNLYAYGVDWTKSNQPDRDSKLSIGSIQGTGEVDCHYYQTVKDMYAITENELRNVYDPDKMMSEPKPGDSNYGYVKYVTPKALKEINNARIIEEAKQLLTPFNHVDYKNKVIVGESEFHFSDELYKKIKMYLSNDELYPNRLDELDFKHFKKDIESFTFTVRDFLKEHNHPYTQLMRKQVSFEGETYHISDKHYSVMKNYLDENNNITGDLSTLANELSTIQSSKKSFFPFLKTTSTSTTTSLLNTPTS
ncbi:hypothetical protein L3V83_11135 [Thiotrichales bacterium 19X7-9]|nr:hypothetical protein [Thiotrichales bacterium 19X7-9]